VGVGAADRPVAVAIDARGRLEASLLDARARSIGWSERYAPDQAAATGSSATGSTPLAGTSPVWLEYMAVERLFGGGRRGYDA